MISRLSAARWQLPVRPVGARSVVRMLVSTGIATVLVAGCSGGQAEIKLPGPTATTPPLSKDAYTKQANEVCRAATKLIAERTDQFGQSSLDGTSSADRQKLVEQIRPIAAQAIERLRNLTPPAADAALGRRAVDNLQVALDGSGDVQAFVDPFSQVDMELNDYGLIACFRAS